MKKKRFLIPSLIILCFTWMFQLFLTQEEEKALRATIVQVDTQNLEELMFFAEVNLDCGYSDVGYAFYAPEDAAENLVHTMNSASASVPGEEHAEEHPASAKENYALDTSSAPWQVVVRGDNEENVVLLEAYGENLSLPLFSKTVSCR